jgi:osmoprotectant transport system ATP-binding protein
LNATVAASIRLEGVRKVYPDGTVAVAGLDLDVPAGEIVVLVGPSGCGKSTILRMVNRLVEPTAGRIILGDEDVTHVDPVGLRRRIGYVIQHVGLMPHQTVHDNVATVPRLLGWPRTQVATRVRERLS